jgi:hypothetical protein
LGQSRCITRIATLFAFPSLSLLPDKKPDDAKRGAGVYPPRADDELPQKHADHYHREPSARSIQPTWLKIKHKERYAYRVDKWSLGLLV